jgi:hypothetical protein
MKKFISAIKDKPVLAAGIFVTAMIAIFFVASFALSFSSLAYSVVTFDTDHGTPAESVRIRNGEIPELPQISRPYNTFGGWFLDKERTIPYNGEAIYYNTTLYAKWDTIFTEAFLRGYAQELEEIYSRTIGMQDFFFLEIFDSEDPELNMNRYENLRCYVFGGVLPDGFGYEAGRIFVFNSREDADRAQEYVMQYDGLMFNNETYTAVRRDKLLGLLCCGNGNTLLGTRFEQDGFVYYIDEYGTQATIMGSLNDESDVVIPSFVQGLPVTSVGALGFFGKSLASISLPDGIKTIGAMAFAGCIHLKELVFPANLEMVGMGFAVMGNQNLAIDTNGSQIFQYSDNALYNNRTNVLLIYTGDSESFEIKEGTLGIGIGAFMKKSNLKTVLFAQGLARIDAYAFYGCCRLEEVYLPKSVQGIGDSAFSCSQEGQPAALRSVVFEEGSRLEDLGVNVFAADTNLQSIEIPKGVTILFEGVFAACTSLKSATFESGSKLKSLRDGIFMQCSSLEEIILPEGLVSMGRRVFEGCTSLRYASLPSTLDSLSDEVFADCTSLEAVHFSSPIKEVGYRCFANCVSLDGVDLSSLRIVKGSAFENCTSIKEMVFMPHPDDFSDSALMGCTGVEKLVLPDRTGLSIPQIICQMTALKELSLPVFPGAGQIPLSIQFGGCLPKDLSAVTVIGTSEYVPEGYFLNCGQLTEINLPDSIKRIEARAFAGCTGLTEIQMPSSLLKIGNSAFEECTSLQTILLPDGLEHIGWSAFLDCESLTDLCFPSGLKSIESCAFMNCTKMSAALLPDGLERVGTGAFGGCSNLKELRIPLADDENTDGNLPNSVAGYLFTFSDGFEYKIEKITILPGVTSIGQYTFGSMPYLEELHLPSTLSHIGNFSFQGLSRIRYLDLSMTQDYGKQMLDGCDSLEELTLNLAEDTSGGTIHAAPWNLAYLFNLQSDPYSSFVNHTVKKITVKGNSTHFGPAAFRGMKALEEVVLPSAMTALDIRLFEGCGSLRRITLPAGLGIIGDKAFYGCTSLEKLTLPPVIAVGVSAFEGCAALETVHFSNSPDAEIRLSPAAFRDCVSLKSVAFFDYSVRILPEYAFAGCRSLVSAELPAGMESIGCGAFENSGLTSIEIPAKVGIIYWAAFRRCNALETIMFPEPSLLREIQCEAFLDCTSLTSVVLPENLELVGIKAFYGCMNLSEITVLRKFNYKYSWEKSGMCLSVLTEKNESGKEYHVGPFDACHPDLKIYVPEDNGGVTEDNPDTGALNGVSAYKQLGIGWGIYKERIFGIGDK